MQTFLSLSLSFASRVTEAPSLVNWSSEILVHAMQTSGGKLEKMV